MLTEEQFRRLEASEGRAFDRRFLRALIRHNEGALLMVENLRETEGAGQEAEISVFSGRVVADRSRSTGCSSSSPSSSAGARAARPRDRRRAHGPP
jgi:Domain of unknown function (DUF305)